MRSVMASDNEVIGYDVLGPEYAMAFPGLFEPEDFPLRIPILREMEPWPVPGVTKSKSPGEQQAKRR